MHVAAVDDQVMRHRIGGRFLVTQLDERADERAGLRRDLDADEAVVMGAGIGGDHEVAGGDRASPSPLRATAARGGPASAVRQTT